MERESWATNTQELEERVSLLLARQAKIKMKINEIDELAAIDKVYQYWQKKRQEFLANDGQQSAKSVSNRVLNAFVKALDPYSTYSTTDESKMLIDNLDKLKCGVGVSLNREPQGYRITKIFDGSPAAEG